MRRREAAFLGLFALSGACGGEESSEPQRVVFDEVRDTTTYIDSATGVRLTSPVARPPAFTVVELPAGFPEFPRPPDALVVDAQVQPVATGGSYSSATLVVERETRRVLDWYRQALPDAGWRVSDESQLDQVHRLKASRGEATLDLIVQVHPDYPGSGWTRIVAFVLEPA